MDVGRGPVQRLRKTASRYAERGYRFTWIQIKRIIWPVNTVKIFDFAVQNIHTGSCVEFPHKFLLRIVYYSSTLASDPWESLMFTLSSRLLELLVNECPKAGARLFWPDEL